MTLAVVLLAAAVVAAAAIVTFSHRPRVLTARAHRPVVVSLLSGATFKGVLVDSDQQALVLKSVEALGSEVVPVDGELVVLRSHVDYLQLP